MPIVFFCIGASVFVKDFIDVSSLQYDFVKTRDVRLEGNNEFIDEFSRVADRLCLYKNMVLYGYSWNHGGVSQKPVRVSKC